MTQSFHEQRARGDDGRLRLHREKPSRKLARARITGSHPGEPGKVPPWEDWENDVYYGSLRRYESGGAFGGGPYAVIGISALSEDAIHDWRDFQAIKNDLVGPEWEAVELYPAESRLVDPSNRFYLFCFPPGVLAALGWPHRQVFDARDGKAPQRAFPKE